MNPIRWRVSQFFFFSVFLLVDQLSEVSVVNRKLDHKRSHDTINVLIGCFVIGYPVGHYSDSNGNSWGHPQDWIERMERSDSKYNNGLLRRIMDRFHTPRRRQTLQLKIVKSHWSSGGVLDWGKRKKWEQKPVERVKRSDRREGP